MITARPVGNIPVSVDLLYWIKKDILKACQPLPASIPRRFVSECESACTFSVIDLPAKENSEDKTFHVHKMQLHKNDDAKRNVAIVYVSGHRHEMRMAMLDMLPFLQKISDQADKNIFSFSVYAYDFRGNGDNQFDKKKQFHDYDPASIHSADLASLLDYLVSKKQEIILWGDSHGSGFALGAINLLLEKTDSEKLKKRYTEIKFISTRAVGHPMNDKATITMVPDLTQREKGREILIDKGWLPKPPFHEIAMKLKNTWILHAHDDQSISFTGSLAAAYLESGRSDRVITLFANGAESFYEDTNPHYARPCGLRLQLETGLTLMDFVAAIAVDKPIRLNPQFSFSIDNQRIAEYRLKRKSDDDDKAIVVPLPVSSQVVRESSDALSVSSHPCAVYMQELHAYCLDQIKDIEKYGVDYNKAKFSGGYSARIKIEKAVEYIVALSSGFQCIEAIKKLAAEEKSPCGEGSLKKICDRIHDFVKDLESCVPATQVKLTDSRNTLFSKPGVQSVIETICTEKLKSGK